MIKEFYKDKVILITGTTGFLGKVVLEKFFRSVGNFKKIYLLVRPKRGTQIMDRVRREIFGSPCFDLVKAQYPDFNQVIDEKIFPIEGDITQDNLAIKPEDSYRIREDVQVIINCAASVDFNERLCDAFSINYYGCLRMHDLAATCKKLQIFTHISTAYVNCNRKGFIEEKIYEDEQDSEELVNRIHQLSPEDQDKNLASILGSWPNTYTFTKNNAEKTLKKRRNPNLPVVLLRPAIIGSSLTEPYPGWTDTFSAAGGLTLAGGMGIINYVPGDERNVADLVPVDYVSNSIIAATALYANKPGFNIVTVGTSHKNPLTWGKYASTAFRYLSIHPFENTPFEPGARFISNNSLLKFLFFMRSELPTKFYDIVASLPFVGGSQLRKDVERLKKINIKAQNMSTLFGHFTSNSWIYETKAIYSMIELMSPEERQIFQFDPQIINWTQAIRLYCYGMQKFIFNQDTSSPIDSSISIIQKNQLPYFSGLRFAFMSGLKIAPKDHIKVFNQVINSQQVRLAIQDELKNTQNKSNGNNPENLLKLNEKVSIYLSEIQAQLRPNVARSFLSLMHKKWQKTYDQLIVNETEIIKVKQMVESKSDHVLLVPANKSYVDFIMITYLHYYFQLDLPFFCGPDDMININFINYLIKSGGGYFQNSKKLNSNLFKAVLAAYIQSLLKNDYIVEMFLEKQRSRSGKIQKPNQELFQLTIKNFLQPEDGSILDKKDLKIVPITVNYDRVYEGESFPLELLGEAKQKESFYRIMKLMSYINTQQGRVNVKYCDPISLKDYIKKYAQKNKITSIDENFKDPKIQGHFIQQLGEDVCYTLTDNLIVMSTQIVATVLLQHRRGISEDELVKKAAWIYEEVKARHGLCSLNTPPGTAVVQAALKYLEGFVDRKRNIFEPSVSAKKNYQNILMLAYYRNNLIHLFINEAFVSCAILGLNTLAQKNQGFSLEEVYQKSVFLSQLFSEEFMVRNLMKTRQDFDQALEMMQKRGFIDVNQQTSLIKINQQDGQQSSSLSFLYHLILPYVGSYWISLTYFSCLDNLNKLVQENVLFSKIQWLAETLYDEGLFKFYESCTLESIRNAISKFTQMQVLNRTLIQKKKEKQVMYQLTPLYQDASNILELSEKILFYLPYSSNMNLTKIQGEIRKVLHSDFQLIAKL